MPTPSAPSLPSSQPSSLSSLRSTVQQQYEVLVDVHGALKGLHDDLEPGPAADAAWAALQGAYDAYVGLYRLRLRLDAQARLSEP